MANLPRSRAIGRVTDGAAVRRQHPSVRMAVLAVVGRAPIVMGGMHRDVLIFYGVWTIDINRFTPSVWLGQIDSYEPYCGIVGLLL